MKQLHFRDTFKQRHYRELNEDQKNSILESHMFLKETRYGKIESRTVVGGNKQRGFIPKEDSSSQTIANKYVILYCIIDAEEETEVSVIDAPNEFIQTQIEIEHEI